MCDQSFYQEAYASLMRGLTELDLQGSSVPCSLVLSGDHAFPLVANNKGQVLMAASLYGRGRVVVIGHESYLTTFPDLVRNAVTWLRGNQSDSQSVGVASNLQAVGTGLQLSGLQVTTVGSFRDALGLSVYVTDAYIVDADADNLVAFLKAGGGVLIAGQAWYWASQNSELNTLLQFPGNKVSGVAGIYFTASYGQKENVPIYPQIPSSWKVVDVGKNFEEDLQFLLRETSKFDIPKGILASEVLPHGPLAFPIGTTGDGQAFLAGSYYGRGRVIVATHEHILQEATLALFWNNAVQWLDQGRNGIIGFTTGISSFAEPGVKYEATEFRKDLSVFVCKAYSAQHSQEIQDFVAEGGGLLIGGHAWYWAQSNPEKNPMTDFSGNKILNKMGLSILRDTISSGSYDAPVPSRVLIHFRQLLRSFAGHAIQDEEFSKQKEQQLAKLGKDCAKFLSLKAYDSYYYTQVLSLLTECFKRLGLPQVSEKNPVTSPRDRFRLNVGMEVYEASGNSDALLPYLIKDNPAMPVVYNKCIRIYASTSEKAEWISTGLYLCPGMKTHVIIPTAIVNERWRIQVGCQTDVLNHSELKRAPSVCQSYPVTSEVVQVSNLWGGLIYLVAPSDTRVEGMDVIVQQAVTAPYYKAGVTSTADWLIQRAAPSPWAELEFDNIILTVPSTIIRELDNIDQVAILWNDIMKGVAELSVIPLKFARKERFVADVQISVGWMHAGYPIMMHSSVAADLVKPNDARTKGLWGEIHELGHNQQQSAWEFPPNTTEATCNLWSVYVHEEVLHINRAQAHPALTTKSRELAIKGYVEGGKMLSDWNAFVALETYLQLQEKFGWDAFKKVFGAYHKMTNVPRDKNGKINLYAETFSQQVGMNLTEFFKAWGWPIDSVTEGKLATLPVWDKHPMAKDTTPCPCNLL